MFKAIRKWWFLKATSDRDEIITLFILFAGCFWFGVSFAFVYHLLNK